MNISNFFNLESKTALVTGGNSGLGKAMAKSLGYAGAKVILTARREEQLQQAVKDLHNENISADYIACDLTCANACKRCIEDIESKGMQVDILINAAGVNLRQPFMEITPEAWHQQINIHLGAPFFLTQAVAPGMASRGWGRIINIASLQSYRAFANSAPYGAGKGGIVQLTRAIAQEWSGKGITCNAIGPGFFPTPLTMAVFNNAELAEKNAAQTCAGRNGKLEDIYGITIFLASDASAYITGQTIMLDGGFTAR